ncbi:MAG: flagellar motor switch protein FliN, partial [Planctomycetaceae bacterium]|nr:flagellar motor switch protein FliN [Planctomycetaceae bacterium]
QSEVEKLLAGLSGGAAAAPEPSPVAASSREDNMSLDQSEVEALFSGKKTPVPSPGPASSAAPNPVQPSANPAAPPNNPKTSASVSSSSSPKQTASQEDGKVLGQNEIETFIKGGLSASTKPAGGGMIGELGGHSDTEELHEDEVPQGDIDYLLKRAEEALDSITKDQPPRGNIPPEIIEFQFPEFGGTTPNSDHATLDQISEVELDLKVELGRTNMYLEDVLKLRKGSVVALDKIAGDAVDIFVNGRLIARGEVLVMNDNFCIRVAELLAGAIPIE